LCAPCSEGRKTVPEDFQEVRRRWSREIVAGGAQGRSRFADRYEGGARTAVWDELHRLDLRRPTPEEVLAEIVACVRLTMRRVRANFECLVDGLPGLGYEFWCPEDAHVPPSPDDLTTLAAVEAGYGPLPLTLRLFYEEVGSVDLRQSIDQIVYEDDNRRATTSPVRTLGEYDPLFVTPLARLAQSAERDLPRLSRPFGEPPGGARLRCWLAPDMFDKANRSGGEDYHVYLPEPAVDFPLVGAYLEDAEPILDNEDLYPPLGELGACEFFLSHLRRSFDNGGFRGSFNPSGTGPRRGAEWEPLRELAARLLPV
jgi:hypothetical protein